MCLLIFIFVVHVFLILIHSFLIIVLFVLIPLSAACTAPVALDGLLSLADHTLVVPTLPICLVSCLLVPPVVCVQVVHVVLESELVQRVQQIVPVDSLAVTPLAPLTCLAGNEGDVLTHALLDGLASLLRDFCILRQGFFHYAADVRYRQVPVLLLGRRVIVFHF